MLVTCCVISQATGSGPQRVVLPSVVVTSRYPPLFFESCTDDALLIHWGLCYCVQQCKVIRPSSLCSVWSVGRCLVSCGVRGLSLVLCPCGVRACARACVRARVCARVLSAVEMKKYNIPGRLVHLSLYVHIPVTVCWWRCTYVCLTT